MPDQDIRNKDPIPGVAADALGNPTIDPTKNVLDLVQAESLRQDGLREATKELHGSALASLEKFQNFAREQESKLQTWQRSSESTRIDQLAQLRQVYETRIAEMLAVSVKSTSDLVSTQLVQIQATFNDRVSKLEQFRWESGGRSSVSDPAITEALSKMATHIASLSSSLDRGEGADKGSRARDKDRRGNTGMVVSIATVAALVVSMIIGAVIFVVEHASAPSLAPVPAAVAVVPVQPK